MQFPRSDSNGSAFFVFLHQGLNYGGKFLILHNNKSAPGWSISRILSMARCAIGQPSLWAERRRSARCSLPGTGPTHRREGRVWRRAASHRPQTKSSLLGLAPGGGYLAARITARAGGLLHHLFTITPREAGLFVSVAHSGRFAPFGGFPTPGYSPTPCSIGVRTFLDPVNAGPRLPDQPEVIG